MSAFGSAVTLVAIGWTALQVSDSVFSVGATFAARFLPPLLIGIPLGGLVDRFDRRKMLVAANLAAVVPLLPAAPLAALGRLDLSTLLVLSLSLGIVDTVRGTASQSYAFDLAGPNGATNALALGGLGAALFAIGGSIAGGLTLERLGIPAAFLLAALAAIAAGALLALIGRPTHRDPEVQKLVPDFRRSVTLIVRNRAVALIALVVILGEVLGFSSLTIFPTFARDVLDTDAAGLGALSAARSVGAIIGVLLLARLGVGGRGGRLVLLATFWFGLSLLGFAASTFFALSILLLLVVGASAAALDTLGQSLIQSSVEVHERGSAMGVWFFAIGFGPVGHLVLGAAANAIGAQLALGISAATLVLVAVALSSIGSIRRLA